MKNSPLKMFQKSIQHFTTYGVRWVLHCEECYTLAMLLRDYRDAAAKMPNIRITASDISE